MVEAKNQRRPEWLRLTPTPLLFQKFSIWIQVRVRQFFKFENPTPVKTPATIINPTEIWPCFYLRNDHTGSCNCRNWKGAPETGPDFHKYLTPGQEPGPNEKRRILPESTPASRTQPSSLLVYLRWNISGAESSTELVKPSKDSVIVAWPATLSLFW